MDGNELRPLQAPLKKRYREQFRWDSEFESGFLQRGVMYEPALTLFAMTSRTRPAPHRAACKQRFALFEPPRRIAACRSASAPIVAREAS
jgi:hypothetical protein